jgi:hypothetical protein
MGRAVVLICANPSCGKEFFVQHRNRYLAQFCSRSCDHEAHTSPVHERFWSKVHICEHGPFCPFCCWEWLGTIDNHGYGKFGWRKDDGIWYNQTASRLVWEFINQRPIPDGMMACHHCDVRNCCSIWHIFIGDNGDNMRDAVRKGRHRGGFTARLDDTQVIEIRELYRQGHSLKTLGNTYGMTLSGIWHIVRGSTYKNIPGALSLEEIQSSIQHRKASLIHDQANLFP